MQCVLALAGASGAVTSEGIDANKQPFKVYSKDLIRVGKWTVPQTGMEFSVTREDLAHWRETFLAMSAAGVKVPVPEGHTDDPAKNRGYVEDMTVDGDTLRASIRLIGDDAIKLASRNEVSIFVPPSLTDGKANTYTRPIAHVALTPVPVISGQEAFVPIAASRGMGVSQTTNVPVFQLAQESAMDLKKLASKFGITTEGVSDDALYASIAAKADELTAASKNVVETGAALSRANTEIATLKASGEKKPLDTDVAEMMAGAVGDKLEALKLSGKINQTEFDMWSGLLVGKPEARPALSLSRAHATAAGLAAPLANSVLAILEKREPARKKQGIELSREVPDDTSGETGKALNSALEANNKRFANSAL